MGLAKRHVKIWLTGKVQGVAFRASTRNLARDLGLKGFVRNEQDGSVYIEAEGIEEQVSKLVTWSVGGPPGARVASIKVEDGEVVGYEEFVISFS